MATQSNGRGRRPVDRKPRKSYYVKKADRVAADQQAQRAFAFDSPALDKLAALTEAPPANTTKLGHVLDIISTMTGEERESFLDMFHPGALLDSLGRRGGTLKACAEAQLLVLKKSADYNNTGDKSVAHTFQAKRDDYFPFGLKSYAQMIHTKSQRLLSLAIKDSGTNFESARDTMLDLINYASFGADWLNREAAQDALVHAQGG